MTVGDHAAMLLLRSTFLDMMRERLAMLDGIMNGSYFLNGKPQTGTRVRAMQVRLKQGGFRSRYRLRKQIVEPVFGQIKQARGFRQCLLRGLDKAAGEWSLLCTAHNLLKLAAATG